MSDRYFFMMSRIQNRILGHIKQEVRKAGLVLSPGQMGILLALEKENQTIMGRLGKILDMDNAALTRLVHGLEEKKLVTRQINPDNRRQILLGITKKGLEQAGVLKGIVRDANSRIEQGFTPAQMETYKQINQSILDKFS